MIRKFLDVSSGHLSEETWTWLDEQLTSDKLHDPHNSTAAQIAGGPTRYGWFVFAPEDTPDDFPDDLLAVLKAARAQGAEYALFDCDAVPQQGPPILHPDFHD